MPRELDAVLAAHERRLAQLDPLLPGAHPLPAAGPGDTPLTVDGAVGIAGREWPDPASFEATWGAADQHYLRARVGGQDPVAAMAALLARWHDQVAGQAVPGDPDSAAVLSWPSRDVAMTRLFLAYGLAPLTVVAARPAARSGPAGTPPAGGGLAVRPLAAADLAAAVALNLEEVRWDAQFGTAVERPSTEGALDREYRDALAHDHPWTWVAELAGEVVGVVKVQPPEQAGWTAPLVTASPAAYLDCLSVTATHRGAGVGAALVSAAHAAVDAVGVGVTLLHYAGLNPLSGPFWHRCGYRPLWTIWQARPATALGASLTG